MRAFRDLVLLLGLVTAVEAAIARDGTCTIFTLLPFSVPDSNGPESIEQWNNASSRKFGIDAAAAALLAMDHFQARDPSVVAELANLTSECNVTLNELAVADNQWDEDTSVRETIREVMRPKMTESDVPCVVLGPADEGPAESTATVTSALGVPQMVFSTASRKLLSVESPTTVGTALTVEGQAQALCANLASRGIDYLYVLSHPSPEANDLSMAIQQACRGRSQVVGAALDPFLIDPRFDPVDWRARTDFFIRRVRASGIKTIFLNIGRTDTVMELASILEQQDMFQDDFVYILLAEAFPTDRIASLMGTQPVDGPVDKLLRGAMIFDRLDGFRFRIGDPFYDAWRRLDAAFVARLNAILPVTAETVPDDYFQTNFPANSVSFIYDAVMTIGFGGCNQVLEGNYVADFVSGDGFQGGGPPMNGGDGSLQPPGGADGSVGYQPPSGGSSGGFGEPPQGGMGDSGNSGSGGFQPPSGGGGSQPPSNGGTGGSGSGSFQPPSGGGGGSQPPSNGGTGGSGSGGFQPPSSGGGGTDSSGGGGFQPPSGGGTDNSGGFQPPSGGTDNGGGFQPPSVGGGGNGSSGGGGGFQPPSDGTGASGSFQPPSGGGGTDNSGNGGLQPPSGGGGTNSSGGGGFQPPSDGGGGANNGGNGGFQPPNGGDGSFQPPSNGTGGTGGFQPPSDGSGGSGSFQPPQDGGQPPQNGGQMPPDSGTGGPQDSPPDGCTFGCVRERKLQYSGGSGGYPQGGGGSGYPPSDGGSGYPPSGGGGGYPQGGGGNSGGGFPPPPPPPPAFLTGLTGLDPLVVAMAGVSFHGASGKVNFIEGEKVRDPSDVTVGLYNVRSVAAGGLNTYEAQLTAVWTNGTWETLSEEAFIYRDGSTVAPLVTREIAESNYLAPWVRGVGLALMVIAWVLGFGCLTGLAVLRKDSAVQRAQPFFMMLLCGGAIITSLAIFTLSFDEGSGWSDSMLDGACMATPWFFFLGQIVTFAALFTKLWRLDKVLQFRRGNKVTIRKVIAPLVALLTTSLLILIVWTVVDPWTWERAMINESPAEDYGQCVNNNFWAFFGPLMALLIFAEALTAFFAWKTNDVPEDFRDSSAVIYAILIQLQAWVIGVPILSVLNNSSAEATYFGRVLLIWIFSISSVCMVVVPKIIKAIRLRRNPHLQNRSRVSVSGLTPQKNNMASSYGTHSTSIENRATHSYAQPVSSHESSDLGQEQPKP